MKYFFLIIFNIISINSDAAKETKKISTDFCEDAIKNRRVLGNNTGFELYELKGD